MNSGSEKRKASYDDQLAALEQKLASQIDDESTLRAIHDAFDTLLSDNGQAENDIRLVLQRQYSAGRLRNETYQLVQQLLERIVSENVPTLPDVPSDDLAQQDPFTDTTVIPGDSFVPVTAEDSLQVGSLLRDRFLLQEKVAGGSMGDVYKALDRRLAESGGDDTFVAIKVLTPRLSRNGNALRALQQEAAKGRCLSHPNIVRFIDLDRDDELYFIVMEWLEGRSLADMLDDGRNYTIDAATALDIVRQIGQALDYAHRCGVVHADVKPGNIIITPPGQAKLFDFGVARVRQKQHAAQDNFDPGVLNARTPVYSSMQVLTGEDPVPADDVFSLGCLLYRLLAGYRVFGPRNAAEAAEAGMEPQRLQGLSSTQWAALRKSLAYSRVARFATVADFLRALDDKSAATSDTQTLPVTDDSASGSFGWRIAIALVLLTAGGLLVQKTGLLERLVSSSSEKAAGTAATDPIMQNELPPDALATAATADVATESSEIVPLADTTAADRGAGQVQRGEQPPATVEKALPEQIDFSMLPSADLLVEIGLPSSRAFEASLSLTEDTAPAIIDFRRNADIALPLTLRLEEVSYSGNRSPWESGQYSMQDDGLVRFEPGQARVRTSITMASDPLREPDREVVLSLRDVEYPDHDFARLNLSLLDDDQRKFEAGLMPNTVAFAVSQVSVRERDPAVQIDVIRFNPDQLELEVDYVVRDVTATEGEDYFAPSGGTISFRPGQRTARIFIPLVQDAAKESDEAFMLELVSPSRSDDPNIFTRIAVMIRDDDS
jgi:serine/threonine protein kinase